MKIKNIYRKIKNRIFKRKKKEKSMFENGQINLENKIAEKYFSQGFNYTAFPFNVSYNPQNKKTSTMTMKNPYIWEYKNSTNENINDYWKNRESYSSFQYIQNTLNMFYGYAKKTYDEFFGKMKGLEAVTINSFGSKKNKGVTIKFNKKKL